MNDNNDNDDAGLGEHDDFVVPPAQEEAEHEDNGIDVDEEDEEEGHDDSDDDDDNNENDDEEEDEEAEEGIENVLEGGVADPNRDGQEMRTASQADIILYLTCTESFPDDHCWKEHPVLRQGVTVRIGLGKATRLSAVFKRYVDFCNERRNNNNNNSTNNNNKKKKSTVSNVEVNDLEFFHCQLLHPQDTAESAALMKNDRISVRLERSAERQADQERQRLQRESDKEYFAGLRHMQFFPDIVLDCRGNIQDEEGRVQQVLSTLVRCHQAIVIKRCPWLGALISAARSEKKEQQRGEQANAVVDESVSQVSVARESSGNSNDNNEEEDEVMPLDDRPPELPHQEGDVAAEIENDEDEQLRLLQEEEQQEGQQGQDQPMAAARDASLISDRDARLLWVTLPNHSPEAVKLLLEYIYSNRVIPLGLDAFVQSCRTKPGHKHQGPVAPFPTGGTATRRWPNRGEPTIPFGVAIAGIKLAEEASMPRFSLMCEVAAAKLVSGRSVVEALSLCEAQKLATGNPLPKLRKAAMDVILHTGPRGVFSLPTFRRALQDRSASLVPSLMTGAMEAVEESRENKKKRRHSSITASSSADPKNDWQRTAFDFFPQIDREDRARREKERWKRRHGDLPMPKGRAGLYDPRSARDNGGGGNDQERWARRKSLKRMSHRLGARLSKLASGRSNNDNKRGAR